jgi:hypothetical protein
VEKLDVIHNGRELVTVATPTAAPVLPCLAVITISGKLPTS